MNSQAELELVIQVLYVEVSNLFRVEVHAVQCTAFSSNFRLQSVILLLLKVKFYEDAPMNERSLPQPPFPFAYFK